ncbi:MAG: hypothetical protein ACJAWL_000088 [Motiliproteus sp.]|jgi:hypothetical protein
MQRSEIINSEVSESGFNLRHRHLRLCSGVDFRQQEGEGAVAFVRLIDDLLSISREYSTIEPD